jgi:hypothetical protein
VPRNQPDACCDSAGWYNRGLAAGRSKLFIR